MEKNIDVFKEINNLEEGVTTVTNLILGPADSMLNSNFQIGFDVASSEKLRLEHEKLELKCRETYGKYAELLHKIDDIYSDNLSEDLRSQRDFMDFVCRSFATRLERRRNVLITSQRFFRLVSEYFDKTSEVFDKLIMGSRTCNLSNAKVKLLKLHRSQHKLERLERELIKEGEKLSDILSIPVKDALCRDVQIDYSEDITNIQDILDATNARKNIFNDSVELQKLTLKQIALVYTYESDVEQAIHWLNDLFNVLIGRNIEIGCNVTEIQVQKQEHQSFQDTARGTYEYGCQMVNGARVLRTSCKLDLLGNIALLSRLREVWRQLRSVSQEQLTRLRVCAVFHRHVSDQCTKLHEMINTVSLFSQKRKRSTIPTVSLEVMKTSAMTFCSKLKIRDVLGNREELLPEVGRMVRLGRLLRSRLKEPLIYQRMSELEPIGDAGSNLLAVQSISARLLEVTRLAEKLDARLCEAGARTRTQDPTSDEAMKSELNLYYSEKSGTAQEANSKRVIQPIQDGDHSVIEDSTFEEYVTATKCTSTPVSRLRSKSFLSFECKDAFFPTTYQKTENESKEKNLVFSVVKNETKLSTNQSDQEGIIKDNPDGVTVIKPMIQEKDGKILKQVTETTTSRVSQNTCMGIASYKLVSNMLSNQNENVDIYNLEDLNRVLINSKNAPIITLQTNHEEHSYTNANGNHKNYLKAFVSLMNTDIIDESNGCYKQEFLATDRTVSEDTKQENKEEMLKSESNAAAPELVCP